MTGLVVGLVVLATIASSCSEIPELPSGAGGMAGTAGMGGEPGSGAVGGMPGGGGTGGGPACEVLISPESDIEGGDNGTGNVATGSVSFDRPSLSGLDEIDRWSVTTCGGAHTVSLDWTQAPRTDLDWAAFASGDTFVEESATRSDIISFEEKVVVFDEEEPLTIEVRAFDTDDLIRTYSLTVSPVD